MTANVQTLTERERETLGLLLEGHDAKSIARTLGLSVHTVNERLRTSRRKLDASSSREAARILAQSTQPTHNSVVNKQIGVAEDKGDVNNRQRHDRGRGVMHPVLLTIGGTLVMSTLIATAMLAWFTSETPEPGPLPNWSTQPVASLGSSQAMNSVSLDGDRLLWNGGEASERNIRHFLAVTKQLSPQPLLALSYSAETSAVTVHRIRLLIDEIVRCEPSTCLEITTQPER